MSDAAVPTQLAQHGPFASWSALVEAALVEAALATPDALPRRLDEVKRER